MSSTIFISYRRDDSAWSARALHESLSTHFGEDEVFIDHDDIAYGTPYPEKLEYEVGHCKVLIAVIGPKWLNARGSDGTRRLDDPDDWVRKEIAIGLARCIPVVPVLIDGASMPEVERLPEKIKRLAEFNAIALNKDSFKTNLRTLCESLDDTLGIDRDKTPFLRTSAWIGAVIAALIGGVFLYSCINGSCTTIFKGDDAPIIQYDPIVEKLVDILAKQLASKNLTQQQKNELIDEFRNTIQALIQLREEPGAPQNINKALTDLEKGDTEEAETIFQEFADRQSDKVKKAAAYQNKGSLAYLHDTGKALDAYRRATELDPENAIAWNQRGHLEVRIGDLEAAEISYQKLKTLGEAQGLEQLQILAYSSLGNVYRSRGDLEKAKTMYEKALELSQVLGYEEGMADAYGNLANFYQSQGDLDQAKSLYEKALELNQTPQREEGMAKVYGNLGNIYYNKGDLGQAETMYKKALELNEALEHKQGMANNYGNLGIVYENRGNLDQAEDMYKKALELNKALGHKQGMAADYGNLGLIYLTRGDLDQAEKTLEKALKLNEMLGRKQGMANDYSNLGIVYQTRGHLDQAEAMYEKALELNEALGLRKGTAAAYGNLGNIYHIRGQLDQAEAILNKALELNAALDHKYGMANNYANLGKVYQTRGDLENAKASWKKSLALFQEIGDIMKVEQLQNWLHEVR